MRTCIHSFIYTTYPCQALIKVWGGCSTYQFSLYSHRAYTLMGKTTNTKVNNYLLYVQRMITINQVWRWENSRGEAIGWSRQASLKKWHMIRGLYDIQKWTMWDLGEKWSRQRVLQGWRPWSHRVMCTPGATGGPVWLELREKGESKWRWSGRDREGPDH